MKIRELLLSDFLLRTYFLKENIAEFFAFLFVEELRGKNLDRKDRRIGTKEKDRL